MDFERGAGPAPAILSADRIRSLADLPPGARATVVEVLPVRSTAVARRLGDLGFTPGAAVEVVRRAPLRDPVVYRVKDYEVCLRRTEAACVRTVGADR
ncbi:ferrous iron transport protein A [Streptomyces olivochromogenes]|nr:ferrous iron transport protein A [Streptomyces olivochromogenes]